MKNILGPAQPHDIERVRPEAAPWADWEDALLTTYSDTYVAAKTGRTTTAVALRRYYLANLEQQRAMRRERFRANCEAVADGAYRRGESWTQDEHDDIIEMRRDGYTLLDIARHLGRTYSATVLYTRIHLKESK